MSAGFERTSLNAKVYAVPGGGHAGHHHIGQIQCCEAAVWPYLKTPGGTLAWIYGLVDDVRPVRRPGAYPRWRLIFYQYIVIMVVYVEYRPLSAGNVRVIIPDRILT